MHNPVKVQSRAVPCTAKRLDKYRRTVPVGYLLDVYIYNPVKVQSRAVPCTAKRLDKYRRTTLLRSSPVPYYVPQRGWINTDEQYLSYIF